MYVTLPKAYDPSQVVYKLGTIIYGLKQSPRNWLKKLNGALTKLGFQEMNSTYCVFVKVSGSHNVVLSIYVDDIIIMSE